MTHSLIPKRYTVKSADLCYMLFKRPPLLDPIIKEKMYTNAITSSDFTTDLSIEIKGPITVRTTTDNTYYSKKACQS